MRLITLPSLTAASYFAWGSYALPNPAASYSVVDVDGGVPEITPTVPAPPKTIYQTITDLPAPGPEKTVSVTIIETASSSSSTTIATSIAAAPAIPSFASMLVSTSSSTVSHSSTRTSQAATATSSAVSLNSTPIAVFSSSTLSMVSPSSAPSTVSLSSTSSTVALSSASTPATFPATSPVSATTSPAVIPSPTTVTDFETYYTTQPASTFTTIEASLVTVISTYTPLPSSTSYYDDGMWHTFYPVEPVATPSPSVLSSASLGRWKPSASSGTAGTILPTNSAPSLYRRKAKQLRPRASATALPVRYNIVSWDETRHD